MTYDPSKHVLFIVGATATGKTDLGVEYAKKHNGAVISADSRQIYIGMDIGTAKAAVREGEPSGWDDPVKYEGIDHYFLDIVYPNERYTVFDFKEQAYELIEKLREQGVPPIVVGGTGLYIDALVKNYDIEAETKENLKVRAKLQKEYEKKGSQKMWNKLKKIDPESAEQIHPNNWRYISRALEIYEVTGKPKSAAATKNNPPFEPYLMTIQYPRKVLYERIEQRIDMQIKEGLVEEARELFEKYDADLPALTSLGYLEIKKYLDGEMSLEEAVDEFKKNTRHFAKRQIGWFRRYDFDEVVALHELKAKK